MPLVLVIDDETQVRALMRLILETAGYKVLEAENGEAGIRLVRTARPDAVVSDILMPVKEGVATIREIRRVLPSAKIVATSGGGALHNMQFLEAARKYGADAILPKPFRPAELAAAVSDVLTQA